MCVRGYGRTFPRNATPGADLLLSAPLASLGVAILSAGAGQNFIFEGETAAQDAVPIEVGVAHHIVVDIDRGRVAEVGLSALW